MEATQGLRMSFCLHLGRSQTLESRTFFSSITAPKLSIDVGAGVSPTPRGTAAAVPTGLG